MFLVNEILVFGRGRRQEALDRLGWIHGLMAKQPGFERALVAKFLGDAVSHTILRFWQDEEAYLTFRQTPDGNYGRGRPEGLYVNEKVIPQWISTKEAAGVESGPFLVKTDWEVPEAAWPAFNEGERQMEDIEMTFGLLGVKQFRAKETSVGITIARFPSRAELEALIESQEFKKAREGLPEGVNRISSLCYEIVSEVTPTT